MLLIPKNSAAVPLSFLMVLSSDHLSAATGKTVTVTIRKKGGAYATPAGAVAEVANGVYEVAGHATDTNTEGPVWLHATAAGCDPTDVLIAQVRAMVDVMTVNGSNPIQGDGAATPWGT